MATITFNSNSLQTANILTQEISHASIPDKALTLSPLAHSNRSVIPYMVYPSRTVTISGVIVDTSVSALESRLDTFKSYFTLIDKNLDIGYGSGTRRYIATAQNVKLEQPGGLTFANFQVDFICTDPFGLDTSTTTVLNDTGVTSGSYAPTCTFSNGTAPRQRPIITLTYTALTGNTGTQTVAISNGATGQTISISRIWSSTDVIVIDTYNKAVTVNSTPVLFTGAFPEFSIGSGSFGYSDQFTTRTFNFNVIYTAAYL